MIKKKKNIIIYIIVGILLIALIIICFFIKNKEKEIDDPNYVKILDNYKDPNQVTVTNGKMKKEQCVNDICIRNVVVTCYPDRGSITYKIINKGKAKVSGYLKLEFDGYTAYLVYNELEGGKLTDGYVGYSGYDLRKVSDYQLRKLSDSDYSIIVK